MSVAHSSKARCVWYSEQRTSWPGPGNVHSTSGVVAGRDRGSDAMATSRVSTPPPDLRNRSGMQERIRNPKPEGAGMPASSSRMRRAIADFNQPPLGKLLQEGEDVALAAFGLHVELLHDGIADVRNARRRLEQLPDAGSHAGQAVVPAALEAENDGLARKIGRHLVLGGDDDRADRDSADGS